MNSYQGTGVLEVLDYATNYNNYLTELVLSFGEKADKFVDFGAGIGTFARKIATRQKQVICVEPCNRQRAIISSQDLTSVARIEELPDESISYLYSLNVLEHIEHDLATLQTIYQKLGPNSSLFIYVPAFNCLNTSFDRQVGHLRRYRRQQLIELLTKAGFQVERAAYADCLGFLVAGLFKLLGQSPEKVNAKNIKIYDRFIFPISKIMDRVCCHWIGKNVWAVARKMPGKETN